MKKVCSLEEYYARIRDINEKLGAKNLFTNCYLQEETVERYVHLKRLYVKEFDVGLLFVSDEESYYKGYYYWDPRDSFAIWPMEKPLLIRNVYQEGRKKEQLCLIEEYLKACGFKLSDSTLQMGIRISEKDKIERKLDACMQALREGGFVLKYAEKEQLSEILALREETAQFTCFTFPYTTEEEFYTEIEDKRHLCIVSQEGRLCAASYVDLLKNYADGNGLCVRPEYRRAYKMGTALWCWTILASFERGSKTLYAWVIKTDAVSRKFHENAGLLLTGRAEDDWVLQKD